MANIFGRAGRQRSWTLNCSARSRSRSWWIRVACRWSWSFRSAGGYIMYSTLRFWNRTAHRSRDLGTNLTSGPVCQTGNKPTKTMSWLLHLLCLHQTTDTKAGTWRVATQLEDNREWHRILLPCQRTTTVAANLEAYKASLCRPDNLLHHTSTQPGTWILQVLPYPTAQVHLHRMPMQRASPNSEAPAAGLRTLPRGTKI